MGLMRHRHGTYYARKKVPKELEEATARVLGKGKRRQAWLKKSLGTKSLRDANILAKPALMEFDRILASAREALKERPTRSSLTRIEIGRLSDYHHATMLGNDAATRREAREIASAFQDEDLLQANVPAYGLTDGEFDRIGRAYDEDLKGAQAALARGNIEYVEAEIEELLELLRIRLDSTTASYRDLGTAVLTAHVKALQALQRRHVGEPIDTPRQPELQHEGGATAGEITLLGWQKARKSAPGTLAEYKRAVALFTELHGGTSVVNIKRSHADNSARRFKMCRGAAPGNF